MSYNQAKSIQFIYQLLSLEFEFSVNCKELEFSVTPESLILKIIYNIKRIQIILSM